MRRFLPVILSLGIAGLLISAGCVQPAAKQITPDYGTAFGISPDQLKAIDWFIATYGDPRTNDDQPARFIEPLITTALDENNLPVNLVTTFPSDSDSVYFWVVYDNFHEGEPIEISWTYLENGKEVTRVQKPAGGDFGRFIGTFQKPDTGWGRGRQLITISGGGTSADVRFEIGDTLQTAPLPYTLPELTAVIMPGMQNPGNLSMNRS